MSAIPYPNEINGTEMENYLAWMKSAYYISAVGNPAISVPCAFSETNCRSGCKSWGDITAIGVYCRWPTRLSRATTDWPPPPTTHFVTAGFQAGLNLLASSAYSCFFGDVGVGM